VHAGAECESRHTIIGRGMKSVQECAEAVKEAGGSFFIYGIGPYDGACYQEHTSSEDCLEGWQTDTYNFYKIDESYTLVHAGAECESSETIIGRGMTLKACAEAIKRVGGSFFIYGIGPNDGACYQEHTSSEDCLEGWQTDHYNFYKIDVPPANRLTGSRLIISRRESEGRRNLRTPKL